MISEIEQRIQKRIITIIRKNGGIPHPAIYHEVCEVVQEVKKDLMDKTISALDIHDEVYQALGEDNEEEIFYKEYVQLKDIIRWFEGEEKQV